MKSFPAPAIIIFDNDGTLVPSHEVANPAIQAAFADFCEKRRIDASVPTDERIRELTGQPGEVFYRALLPAEHQSLASELRSFCLDREVVEMLRRARFYDGIVEMLRELQSRGVLLALASHGGERYIGAVAQRLGYGAIFDRIYFHGRDGLLTKGAMARRAMGELGASTGLFVGDRRADLEAAREVGMGFAGCLYGYGSREELEGADYLLRSPTDLASCLLDLTSS
jgi:phosphoglycolate phosphatase-like HAD superfamily hydrolase